MEQIIKKNGVKLKLISFFRIAKKLIGWLMEASGTTGLSKKEKSYSDQNIGYGRT